MTDEDEQNFQKASEYHISEKKNTARDIKVRDLCHITGNFRGSAHQDCNLRLRIKPYRNLELYLDLGLKLIKIHRVLEFNQSPWLKQYIDFNTQKRTNAKNSLKKDFFTLMNSVFGNTMENIRKRTDVKLVTSKDRLLKLVSKPTYISSKICNKNLVAVHKKHSLLIGLLMLACVFSICLKL